jgi:D-3-phosphoglycerate dehydrogenase
VNLMALRAETETGEVRVAGTAVGARDGERLVQVFDFGMDMAPARYMAFFLYEDRPGVIGKVGSILGQAGINIASMEVGRREAGGPALMGLTVDSPIPFEQLGEIELAIGATTAKSLELPWPG